MLCYDTEEHMYNKINLHGPYFKGTCSPWFQSPTGRYATFTIFPHISHYFPKKCSAPLSTFTVTVFFAEGTCPCLNNVEGMDTIPPPLPVPNNYTTFLHLF